MSSVAELIPYVFEDEPLSGTPAGTPAGTSTSRPGHRRRCSSYADIGVPALPEEPLSAIETSTKPRCVWTDITKFHESWQCIPGNVIHDALLILPDVELQWITDPKDHHQDHSIPALRDGVFLCLLQWQHSAGHLFCVSNNAAFWAELSQQLTECLTDPATFNTATYGPLILNQSHYRSNSFCPKYGAQKGDIVNMLNGHSVGPPTARAVIKEVLLHSISSLHFVAESGSLSAADSTLSSPTLDSKLSAVSMDDLSDDEFLESLLSDGLSDGFPSTWSGPEYISSPSPQCTLTPPSFGPLSTIFESAMSPIAVRGEEPAAFPSTTDFETALSRFSFMSPPRLSAVAGSSATTFSDYQSWPLPRTASEEAEDQKQFTVMSGSTMPEGKWHISELYFDQNMDFMRSSTEKTQPFPLPALSPKE